MKKVASFFKLKKNDHPHGHNEYLNFIARYRLNYRFPPGHPIFLGPYYDWQDILSKTQNRAATHLLGRGGFGPVYRCDLGTTVGAVKFQDKETAFGSEQFIAEITALHRADHVNVIKLLGQSIGRNKLALIYEFMPGGSLDHHLLAIVEPGPGLGFAQNRPVLGWERRMSIAEGVARALVYVHTELKMIHRDVKVQNVLLDQNYVPKLTDFGFAVNITEAENGTEMDRMIKPAMGTIGCAAPETSNFGIISTKSDVYSYGVFLLQLFSGRLAWDPDAERSLTDSLKSFWRGEDTELRVLDERLNDRFSVKGAKEIFKVARMCTHLQASLRPDMRQVLTDVHNAASVKIPVLPELPRSRTI